MTAVGELVLLLGLLLAAHCDVRARDPEVEEEEEATAGDSYGGTGRSPWDSHVPPMGGFGVHPHNPHPHPHPHPHGRGHGHELSGGAHHGRGDHGTPHSTGHGHGYGHHGQGQEAEPGAPNGDGSSGPQTIPARTGNWCAYVHRRAVTTAVSCGTEKYTIKSQSPCPSGSPDCQIIMYKLSTRPVYREKQKIFTALLWRCCPGHGGENCDDPVPDGQDTDPQSPTVAGRTHPGGPPAEYLGPEAQPQLIRDQSWDGQNDFEVLGNQLYEARGTPAENDTSADLTYDYPHSPPTDHDHSQHSHNQQGPVTVDVDAHALPYPLSPGLQHLPQVAAIILAQLQPVLDGFNHTLAHLSLEVGSLSRDVAELKLKHEIEEERVDHVVDHVEDREESGADPDPDPGHARDPDPEALGHMPDELLGFNEYLPRRLEQLEERLEDSFQQIAELQRQLEGRLHYQQTLLHYNLTSFKTDIDSKLKRQQKHLQHNLQALNSSILELRQGQEHLEEELQRSWDTPIEQPVIPAQEQPPAPPSTQNTALWEAITRLDERVVNNTVRVDALTEGMQLTDKAVRKLQGDLDNLDEKIESTGRKSQIQFMETGLEVDAARAVVLQRVEELANNLTLQERQLVTMDDDMEYLYKEFHGNVSNCQATLARMQEAIANVDAVANQNRATLQTRWHSKPEGWYDLLSSVEDLKQGMSHVQNSLAFEQERTRVLNSNVSLLQTILLASQQDIQALQNKEDQKEGKVKYLENSFSSLLKDAVRHAEVLEVVLGMEVLEFMDLPEKQKMLHSIPATMKMIQDLKEQLKTEAADQPAVLDAPPSGVVVKLQAEVNSLSRGLEDHLQEFKSLFSNTEGLSGSDATVDLDKLSGMMKRKEAKQQKRQQKKVGVRGEKASHRNKRDASLETTGVQTANLAFVASTNNGKSKDGPLIFEDIMLDRGQMYSTVTGLFRAPVKGLYLFVVTLDFGPGTSVARLIRGNGVVAASLHQSQRRPAGPATRVCLLHLEQGEQLYLELPQGSLEVGKPEDNTFAGLLLHQTT